MTSTRIDTRQRDGDGRKAAITKALASRKTRVFLWRLAAAMTGAALFGLVAAPLLPLPWLPASLVLALAFCVAFVGGSGYGIVGAVFFPEAGSKASASWTGASVSTAAGVAVAATVLVPLGGDLGLLLSAYAIAIGIAYSLAKAACLEAGCCTAVTRVAGLDLRHAEILASAVAVALAAGLLGAGQAGLAAIAGAAGHLSVRIASRAVRHGLPRIDAGFDAGVWELTLLSALLAAALSAAAG